MTIALVQQTPQSQQGYGSLTISAPAAGNTLFLFFRSTGPQITAVSGGGVTWSQVASWTDGAGSPMELWAGANSSGSGTSVTVSTNNNYAIYDFHVSEWSGMPASLTTDGGSSQLSSNPSESTPSVTPTGTTVLLLAGSTNYPYGFSGNTLGGGFTMFDLTGLAGYGKFAYRIADPASGSYQCTFQGAGYGSGGCGLYAFDGSGGGGGGGFARPYPFLEHIARAPH